MAIAMQLHAPIYNASSQSLSYKVVIIERFPPAYGSGVSTATVPSDLTRVSLFIDDSKADLDRPERYERDREDCWQAVLREVNRPNRFIHDDPVGMATSIEKSCQKLNLSDSTKSDMRHLANEVGRTREWCGVHGSCGRIEVGDSFSSCWDSCKDAGCDTKYRGGDCWCSTWCAGRFNPIPVEPVKANG